MAAQIKPDLSFENALWNAGLQWIAGVDEAGRGAWAGPVAAGAVILPVKKDIAAILEGVRDSKQMTPGARRKWAGRIRQEALGWAVGFASNEEIDEIGIAAATRLAVRRALAQLDQLPQHLLVDYLKLPEVEIPQTPLVKGDARCLSIAAASVLAKTARDERMEGYAQEYPGYGFDRHKGYGTRLHQAGLIQHGACAIHRLSFRPVRQTVSTHSGGKD